MQRCTLRFGEKREREREEKRGRKRTSNAKGERGQAEEKVERERKRGRETEREKEGCALTVGIHERSPPGGLACERTLCSSLSAPCLPPSFSFSPLTYRLIFFTGPEVGGPRIFGCRLPTLSYRSPGARRTAHTGNTAESVICETARNSLALINRLYLMDILIGHRDSSRLRRTYDPLLQRHDGPSVGFLTWLCLLEVFHLMY